MENTFTSTVSEDDQSETLPFPQRSLIVSDTLLEKQLSELPASTKSKYTITSFYEKGGDLWGKKYCWKGTRTCTVHSTLHRTHLLVLPKPKQNIAVNFYGPKNSPFDGGTYTFTLSEHFGTGKNIDIMKLGWSPSRNTNYDPPRPVIPPCAIRFVFVRNQLR